MAQTGGKGSVEGRGGVRACGRLWWRLGRGQWGEKETYVILLAIKNKINGRELDQLKDLYAYI